MVVLSRMGWISILDGGRKMLGNVDKEISSKRVIRKLRRKNE
jgi:hypothetical protein